MKTPEEIKLGIECCIFETDDTSLVDHCRACPYQPIGLCFRTLLKDALAYIQQLEAQVPKWISVENPPQVEGEYIVIVQLPDGKKERMWDVYHPYHGWCEDAENKVVCWMSFDSLPEPPKEG